MHTILLYFHHGYKPLCYLVCPHCIFYLSTSHLVSSSVISSAALTSTPAWDSWSHLQVTWTYPYSMGDYCISLSHSQLGIIMLQWTRTSDRKTGKLLASFVHIPASVEHGPTQNSNRWERRILVLKRKGNGKYFIPEQRGWGLESCLSW